MTVRRRGAGLWPARPAGLEPAQVRDLIGRLNGDGARLAAQFGLRYRAIVAERPSVRAHYGICYEDGLIKIRLQHATRGTPLKYSSLVNTLCHELAHLAHFDHGDDFKQLYEAILAFARRAWIYRPGRQPGVARPLALEECGVSPEERRAFLEGMRAAAARVKEGGPAPPGPLQLQLFEVDS